MNTKVIRAYKIPKDAFGKYMYSTGIHLTTLCILTTVTDLVL
jgi:hypothetical protein